MKKSILYVLAAMGVIAIGATAIAVMTKKEDGTVEIVSDDTVITVDGAADVTVENV